MSPTAVPLESSAYTQPPGRDDFYFGSIEANLADTCVPPRGLVAFLVLDGNPSDPMDEQVIASGQAIDVAAGGAQTLTVNFGSVGGLGSFQPAAATNHALSLGVFGICSSGSGLTVSNAVINVLGAGK